MSQHYHVMLACREHGPNNMVVVENEQEGLEFVHEKITSGITDSGLATISNVYRTPNIIEFRNTFPNGEVHEMFAFLLICNEDIQVCRAILTMQAMEGMTRLRRLGLQDKFDEALDNMTNSRKQEEEIDPSVFNSIEAFLNQQQEGDGTTH